jgi:hypothetical protein
VEHTGDGTAPPFVLIGVPEDESAEAWERRNNPELKGKLQ